MEFEDFERIITLVEECHNTTLKPVKCWDLLIDELFKQIYEPEIIDCLLVRWLKGEREPVFFTSERGVSYKFKMNTLKDLYKCMEKFKKRKRKRND